MAKKRKKLDQFLQSRKQSQESVIEEGALLSNRLFRWGVGALVVLVLVAMARPQHYSEALGLTLLFGLAAALGTATMRRLEPGLFPDAARFNRYIAVVVGTAALAKALLAFDWPAALAPVPLLAMILSMAYSQLLALFSSAGMAFYVGLLALREGGMAERGALELALQLSLGAVVALLGVRRVRKQSQPAIVGLYVGAVQALALAGFRLVSPEFRSDIFSDPDRLRAFLLDAGYAFAGPVLYGAVVTTLLPLLERIFDVVTERRLLELADPNNRLLRVLRERAPGTFQHTLGVQQLARAAAEAIGADSLLCDVGAYYHDIGKIYKPEYFVENMTEDKTIHDRLRPSMSKLIILSHVKDGIELAREEKLPQKVIDMIPMHHGTTVVQFFYRKAQKESELHNKDQAEESEYRYPGPKPRFKEAGILMLADAVEAIAKTISEPTPSRFRDMVRKVIHDRLLDGQLDECDLTMADLRKIEDSFVRTLTTMYHGRIKYPSQPGEEPEAASSERKVRSESEKEAQAEPARETVRGAK